MTDGGGHGLTRVQTVVETLSNQFVASIGRVAIPLCEMADRLESAEPVPDYDPMLVERGHHPPMSRGLSYGFVGLGKDGARMITMDWVFADALRFLAKPGRKNHSIPAWRWSCLKYGTQLRPPWAIFFTAPISACLNSSRRSKVRFEANSPLVAGRRKLLWL
jgi:hypothetical protein